jgi:serine/threonine-protein phosphatase 2A activator
MSGNRESNTHQHLTTSRTSMPTTVRPGAYTYSSNTYNPSSTQLRRQLLEQQQQQQQQQMEHPMDPEVPRRHIFNESDMIKFKQSEAYSQLEKFIYQLAHLITNRKLSDIETKYGSGMSDSMKQCLANLDKLESFIEEYPPTEETKSISRYGNLAYRQWFDRMMNESDQMQIEVLKKSQNYNPEERWKYKELSAYWRESFGNRTRIDYGTGHEVSFCAYMYCLAKLGVVNTESDCMCLVGVLFPHYLEVMRKIQLTYKLEPAGSHGVWGLDDYSFLPFLFGSAQLEMNTEGIEPSSIHNRKILDQYSQDYMYLAAIQFIHKVKKGPFAEHSPILNDISGVPNWKKIASGMIKMYKEEVLGKFVVVQHFLFGRLLPFEPVNQSS